MTTWDNIYKSYTQGGDAYGTLSEDLHPLFKDFLKSTSFPVKQAFDIGFVTGHYLKHLQTLGFKISGLDSSPTAITLAQKELGSQASLSCAEMYTFPFPSEQYDLILSISTLHHGTKAQIAQLISSIYSALLPSGWIFLTLPSLQSRKWKTADHEEITSGTVVPLSGPEKGLPHSFYSQAEVEELFSSFHNLKLGLDYRHRWVIRASK